MFDNEASNRDNDAVLDAQEGDECDRTVVVSIGRKYSSGETMSLPEWKRFIRELRQWAGEELTELYFLGEGEGWSSEWGAEDSYTVIGTYRFWKPWPVAEERLYDLRREFEQEAVAVSWVDTTTFV